jgi:hypothetical protein
MFGLIRHDSLLPTLVWRASNWRFLAQKLLKS